MRYVLCTNTHTHSTTISIMLFEFTQKMYTIFSPSLLVWNTRFLIVIIRCFEDFSLSLSVFTFWYSIPLICFYACWAASIKYKKKTTCDVVHSRENNSFGSWTCISMTKYQIWSSALLIRSHRKLKKTDVMWREKENDRNIIKNWHKIRMKLCKSNNCVVNEKILEFNQSCLSLNVCTYVCLSNERKKLKSQIHSHVRKSWINRVQLMNASTSHGPSVCAKNSQKDSSHQKTKCYKYKWNHETLIMLHFLILHFQCEGKKKKYSNTIDRPPISYVNSCWQSHYDFSVDNFFSFAGRIWFIFSRCSKWINVNKKKRTVKKEGAPIRFEKNLNSTKWRERERKKKQRREHTRFLFNHENLFLANAIEQTNERMNEIRRSFFDVVSTSLHDRWNWLFDSIHCALLHPLVDHTK